MLGNRKMLRDRVAVDPLNGWIYATQEDGEDRLVTYPGDERYGYIVNAISEDYVVEYYGHHGQSHEDMLVWFVKAECEEEK